MAKQYRTGDLAYYDSMTVGLIPVRVIAVRRSPLGGRHHIDAVVTGGRDSIYKRGEIIYSSSDRWVIPRKHVRKATKTRQAHVIGGYEWLADD